VGHADPVHALSWITQSAYKGFPEALDAQGDYFAYGLAGARDPAGALVSYQTAAQFNPKAMWNLIIRYHQGDGVPVDPAKMKYYLEQLRLSASHGDAEADYYLGDLYRNGLLLSGNSQEALSRFQRAAEGGEGKAFYRMAEMYESGEGVPRDERAAFQHYRHSAQLFYLPAFYNVAVGLLAGAGTPRNPREAAEWFLRIQRGAARGVPAHQLSLARCYERGLFVPRDEAKAVSTYQSAALRGDVDAERVLAGMIRDGRGVPKNIPLAIGWLDRAARRGDVRARRLKEALLRTLPTRLRAQAVSQALTFHPEDASQK
jgi:TPR repeat protein